MVMESGAVADTNRKEIKTSVTRFDIHQIIQHAGLGLSFIVLVLTGLPMKFSDSALSRWWVGIWGGIEVTRTAHHVAAWVITAVCLYHVGYIMFTVLVRKKPFPVKILPTGQDFVLLYREVLYFIGVRRDRPRYDRFNWREKFDYWAIFWGMPVMVISGAIMMFPVMASKILPGWIIPAALVAHSDEAVLALSWIVIVHIFFNHFSPGVFPLNTSMFSGKVRKERYQKEHPVEYQHLIDSGKIEPD